MHQRYNRRKLSRTKNHNASRTDRPHRATWPNSTTEATNGYRIAAAINPIRFLIANLTVRWKRTCEHKAYTHTLHAHADSPSTQTKKKTDYLWWCWDDHDDRTKQNPYTHSFMLWTTVAFNGKQWKMRSLAQTFARKDQSPLYFHVHINYEQHIVLVWMVRLRPNTPSLFFVEYTLIR